MSEGISRAPERHGESLAGFYSRYGTWLRRQVLKRYGYSWGEDILQDTWLNMARVRPLGAIRYPKAFLLKVALNSARSEARRRAVMERVEAQSLSNDGVLDAEQIETVVLRETILGLPQPLRDVFVLSRLGGLTNQQIAEHLGIRPKTVEWRMTKALAHCAAQFRR